MQKFFKQFSFPGHIGSHVTPETPGSIHEGGELGYSLSHAYGAALDNPDLIVACVVGDGEAETGPLATAWHSNKFINPVRDGDRAADTQPQRLQDRQPDHPRAHQPRRAGGAVRRLWLQALFRRGRGPAEMHQKMAATLDTVVAEIRAIQKKARDGGKAERPRWPMIVLRSPKGWTGPKEIDGHKVEGSWRSHQVPFSDMRGNPANMQLLESWLRSYRPEELFDAGGRLRPELKALAPEGKRRMSANPHANGGVLRRELKLPDFRDYAVEVPHAGKVLHENTKPLGEFLRDTMRNNMTTFRVFGPDETASNRLQSIYQVEQEDLAGRHAARGRRRGRARARWAGDGDALGAHARGMAGRLPAVRAPRLLPHLRGIRPCGGLDVQPAREMAGHLQEPRAVARIGVVAKHPAVVDRLAAGSQRLLAPGPGLHRPGHQQEPVVARVYLPPDANTLLVVADECLRSTDCINVIVADKQKHLQFTPMDEAIVHCARASASGGARATTRARNRTW